MMQLDRLKNIFKTKGRCKSVYVRVGWLKNGISSLQGCNLYDINNEQFSRSGGNKILDNYILVYVMTHYNLCAIINFWLLQLAPIHV